MGFQGMTGQKNESRKTTPWRPVQPASNLHRALLKTDARQRNSTGRVGTFSRPDLAIPRRVAPQQSPTPFRQTLERSTRRRLPPAKKIQNRPNAPSGSTAAQSQLRGRKRSAKPRFSLANRPTIREEQRPTAFRQPVFTHLVHLPVLTRPFLAGFHAPDDSLIAFLPVLGSMLGRNSEQYK
jgi:hypothetical protein